MLAGADSLDFHYCREPASALTRAAEISPTVVLLDLVMPDVDGLEVLRRMRADERFQDLPIIVLSTKEEPAVKAEAFALGANDYLVKLPDRIELVARVRHHSRGYVALLERNLAFAELRVSREMLANDLASAARYVRSLLPPPGEMAGIRADWRFIPSADLGGDAFGYHRLDDDQVAIYLLDVCGHGVGAALLSVSALNAIRGEALPNTDFRDPAAVLAQRQALVDHRGQGLNAIGVHLGQLLDPLHNAVKLLGQSRQGFLRLGDARQARNLSNCGDINGHKTSLEFQPSG